MIKSLMLGVAAAAIMAGTAHAAETDGLLFYASFDKDLDADFAKGPSASSGVAETTESGAGFSGEALIAQRGWYGVEQYTGIKYLLTGNVNHLEGTLEFHVKPLPGFLSKSDDWRRIFVCSYEKVFEDRKRLYRWVRVDFKRTKGEYRLRVYEDDMHSGHHSHLQKVSPGWQEGKWYHVAYCWQGKERTLFVDGKLVASGQATGPEPLPKAGAYLYVGGGLDGGECPDALIDELKIWDRVKYRASGD